MIRIKQKAGCAPHSDDPNGFKSLVAQCLSRDQAFQWHSSTGSVLLKTFRSDDFVTLFLDHYIKTSKDHCEVKRLFISILYECCAHENQELLPLWLELLKFLFEPAKQLSGPGWQNFSLYLDLARSSEFSASNLTSASSEVAVSARLGFVDAAMRKVFGRGGEARSGAKNVSDQELDSFREKIVSVGSRVPLTASEVAVVQRRRRRRNPLS